MKLACHASHLRRVAAALLCIAAAGTAQAVVSRTGSRGADANGGDISLAWALY